MNDQDTRVEPEATMPATGSTASNGQGTQSPSVSDLEDALLKARLADIEGRMVIANEAYLAGGDSVVFRSRNNGHGNDVRFKWNREGIGFGELVFFENEDGGLSVDTESMGGGFCLDVIRQAMGHPPSVAAVDPVADSHPTGPRASEPSALPLSRSEGWQPMENCWITSRVGEERQRILVYGEMGHCLGYVIDYGDGTRHVAAEGFQGDWKITHWMPLPSPPKA